MPLGSAKTRLVQQIVMTALNRSPVFFSAALPKRVLPPMFDRYAGQTNAFGDHIDNAVRFIPGSHGERLRNDISCTLFLAEPDELAAGDLVLTRGPARDASSSDEQRRLLWADV